MKLKSILACACTMLLPAIMAAPIAWSGEMSGSRAGGKIVEQYPNRNQQEPESQDQEERSKIDRSTASVSSAEESNDQSGTQGVNLSHAKEHVSEGYHPANQGRNFH